MPVPDYEGEPGELSKAGADPNMAHFRAMAEDLAQLNPKLRVETLTLQPACNWAGHAAGHSGCEADAPAEFVIMVMPHCTVGNPQLILVCAAQYHRVERSHEVRFTCNVCGQLVPLISTLELCGPIKDYRP